MSFQVERVPQTATPTAGFRQRLENIWETTPGIAGWFSSVDHKEIGIRYIVTAFAFLVLGGIEALIMRVQLAGPNEHLLTPEQYDQLFSTHGMTMIFLYALPILSGFSNYLWPLLLGARDMAFPRVNALSYWLYLAAGLFMYAGFAIGAGPNDGWFNYVPYANREYNPGLNMDFYCAGHDLPRHLDHGRRGEFHRHVPSAARAGHVDQPRADHDLGHADGFGRQYSCRAGVSLAFFLLWMDRHFGTHFFDVSKRRPAAALAASVLDLRSSLGLCDRAAGDGHGLGRTAGVLPPSARRL